MYGLNMIEHFRSMYQSANSIGARVKVDFTNLHLEISRNDKYVELVPSFASFKPDQNWLEQEATMSANANIFTGWRVGGLDSLPIRDNRIVFKKFCETNGVLTPRLFLQPTDPSSLVLIKEISPARRGTIHGPMRAGDAFDGGGKLLEGQYVEEFVEGDPIQVYYFAGEVACVERRKKSTITGDSKTSARKLIDRLSRRIRASEEAGAKYLLQIQGLSLDTVLSNKQLAVVDFNFHSALQHVPATNENVLGQLGATRVIEQLERAGLALSKVISNGRHSDQIIQVNGIIDAQDNVWFVSVSPAQYVHPDVYCKMIPAIFDVKIAGEIRDAARMISGMQH